MWLTKDTNLPEPRRISDDAEQGSYVFFNHRLWEKVRVREYEALPSTKTDNDENFLRSK